MLKTVLIFFCLMAAAGLAVADTKIKSRQTSGGQTYENTSYIKGKRQRQEAQGGQTVMLTQCDLRRNIQIMPQTRTYMIQPYDQPSSSETTTATSRPSIGSQPGAAKKGGVVTSTVTTRDTGERKQMFGYTARHIITTIVMDSTPDACSPVKSKMEIDGWYIDAAFALDCDLPQSYTPYRPSQAATGCRDRYETKQIGTAKRGFAVWERMTMFGPDGSASFSSTNEVIEFSQATLDASLFEIPEGYSEVKDFASLYGAPSNPSINIKDPESGNVPTTTAPATTAATQPANKPASEVGPKKAGVIRFGLVAVKAGNVGEGMNASNLALAVQNTLPEKMKGTNVEVVPIQATVLAQIEAEARQKECDYLIYSTVSHKKGGGGLGGLFGNTAAAVAGSVGYGSTAAAVTANVATAAVAESIKAKDEVSLDVRLEKPGAGYPMFAKQFKGKAKASGEDVITPLATQASQAIIEAATKK